MATVTETALVPFKEAVKKRGMQIQTLLPPEYPATKYMREALLQIEKNPFLAKCDPMSFAIAVLDAAALGLSFSNKEAYLVPYKDRDSGKYIVQMQPSYMGLVKCAYDTGMVSLVESEIIYEGEEHRIWRTEDGVLHFSHEFDLTKRINGKEIAFVAIITVQNGIHTEKLIEVCVNEDIDRAEKASPTAHQGKQTPAYRDWRDQMGRKLPLKRACKLVKRDRNLAMAIESDNAAVSGEAFHAADVVLKDDDFQEIRDELPKPEPQAEKAKRAIKEKSAPPPATPTNEELDKEIEEAERAGKSESDAFAETFGKEEI